MGIEKRSVAIVFVPVGLLGLALLLGFYFGAFRHRGDPLSNDPVHKGAWEMAEQSAEIHCRFRVADTRRTMEVVGAALHLYRVEHGRYPARLLDLAERPSEIDPSAWRLGGYLGQISLDGWVNEFVYRVQGRNRESYDLISLGMDGREGGEGFDADIRYEKDKLPEEKK